MLRVSLFYLGVGFLVIALSLVSFQCFRYERAPASAHAVTEGAAEVVAGSQSSFITPDLKALAYRMHSSGVAPPSAASIAEERRVVGDQVSSALIWLRSAEVKQRIEGAEQLGAYPTADAERALIAHLHSDPSPEVRVAAANSLGFFSAPSDSAIRALVRALEDHHADVSAAALSTVQIVLQGLGPDSVRARQLLRYVRQAIRSRKMDSEIREQLQSLLTNP